MPKALSYRYKHSLFVLVFTLSLFNSLKAQDSVAVDCINLGLIITIDYPRALGFGISGRLDEMMQIYASVGTDARFLLAPMDNCIRYSLSSRFIIPYSYIPNVSVGYTYVYYSEQTHDNIVSLYLETTSNMSKCTFYTFGIGMYLSYEKRWGTRKELGPAINFSLTTKII